MKYPSSVVRSIPLIFLFVAAQFPLCRAEAAEEVKISKPSIEGYRLDWCRDWGKNCGKRAADSYCRKIGHARATKYSIAKDIGKRSPTRVINGGKICNQKVCDGFKYVKCELKGATLNNPDKYIPKKDKKPKKAIWDEDKADGAFEHTFPATVLGSYQSLANDAIRAIANDHNRHAKSLISKIENSCATAKQTCYLDKKLKFIRDYLNQ